MCVNCYQGDNGICTRYLLWCFVAQFVERASQFIAVFAPVLLWLLRAVEKVVGKITLMTHGGWKDALFVHYEVDPEELQRCLPAGLVPDLLDGKAYIGVVLLMESDIRPFGGQYVPISITHHAANVRTYVKPRNTRTGLDGTPGIFFFSLDCTSVLATLGARSIFGLPYMVATMERETQPLSPKEEGRLTCTECDSPAQMWSKRRPLLQGAYVLPQNQGGWQGRRFRTDRCASPASASATYSVQTDGTEQRPDAASDWLLERYCLYQCVPDRLFGPPSLLLGRVRHPPWKLLPVRLGKLDETLLDSALPPSLCGSAHNPAFVHFANTGNVRFSLFESFC